MKKKATIIIPTFNHAQTLNYSIASALNQTEGDIEVFVIGDGVPDITKEILRKIIKKDKRVRFFDNPKGPRHGEINRHAALKEASGEIVTYLADDDLYLSNHIEIAYEYLKEFDYIHTLTFYLSPEGKVFTFPGDLSIDYYKNKLMNGRNFIPLGAGAHTMKFYRKLPYGWRTTPAGTHTDMYMWQQILSVEGVKSKTIHIPTLLHFPSPHREGWTIQERLVELEKWAKIISDPEKEAMLVREIYDQSFQNLFNKQAELITIKSDLYSLFTAKESEVKILQNRLSMFERSRIWRFKEKIKSLPFIRKLI